MTIKLPCLECGNLYYVRPSQVDLIKFCSKDCKRKNALKSLPKRYQEKVDKRGSDECWPWLGYMDQDGYGTIRPAPDKSSKPAHRVGYELEHGPLPDDILVCHKCDNPPCQNPNHWFTGTVADNNADKIKKGRNHKKLTTTQVFEIFRLKGKEYQYVTAKRYNISWWHVCAIQNKRAWTWLLEGIV